MTFKKSLSCRIAEGFLSKEEASMSFPEFAELAKAAGFDAVCMRASQMGVHSPGSVVEEARRTLDALDLQVSMVTGDFDIVYNNERGPNCLRNIEPYLNLAEALGSSLIRICIKHDDDLPEVRKAADLAAERDIRLLQQCHIQSLFETLDDIERCCREVDHPHFGLIFEAANLEQCGQAYGPAAIQRLAPWIANVYLQNQRIHAEGGVTLDTWSGGPVTFDVCEIPDPGGIDFSAVSEGLRHIGYEGFVTVHQSAPDDKALSARDAAQATAKYLAQI